MDYSAISHDPADPAAPSPWGSVPPEQAAFAATHQSPYSDHDQASRPASSSAEQEPTTPRSPGLSERVQNTHLGDEQRTEQSPQSPPAQQGQATQPQKSQTPARYQTGARQNANKPPAPTYRLQAKVTGLERTGKKDPIIRFDVYV